jgi:hypothetical protein
MINLRKMFWMVRPKTSTELVNSLQMSGNDGSPRYGQLAYQAWWIPIGPLKTWGTTTDQGMPFAFVAGKILVDFTIGLIYRVACNLN